MPKNRGRRLKNGHLSAVGLNSSFEAQKEQHPGRSAKRDATEIHLNRPAVRPYSRQGHAVGYDAARRVQITGQTDREMSGNPFELDGSRDRIHSFHATLRWAAHCWTAPSTYSEITTTAMPKMPGLL
jgi:hypothetical protein